MGATDGEVVYTIRGDDSQLDNDLEAAEKKAQKSAEETSEKVEQTEKKTAKTKKEVQEEVTEHHEEQNKKREQSDDDSHSKREESSKKHGEKLKSIAGGTAKAIGAGMLAVGSAAVGVGAMALNGANDMDKAMNQYIASTGKSTEETERYRKVLENIYTNNYGDSFEDISAAMADVNKQLGDMSDEELQTVTESAFALRDTFGYEILESTRAAKAMMDNFGISGEEAMSLIAAGAQNGLDYSGELIDSISEYSVQFAKVGLDADDMFKIFQKGAESGAFNLDKVGDAVKEFSIRAIDGSEATAEGFAAIGLNADDMAEKFATGGETAKEAFEQTVEALAAMEDPLAQNAAGVALFGTMWEDLGPEAVAALADIEEGAYDTANAMEGIKAEKYDDLGSMFESLKRSVEMLLIPLGEMLIPLLTELLEEVMPVIQEAIPPLLESIAPIISMLSEMLIPVIELLLDTVTVVFEGISNFISKHADIITGIFSGLIKFIKGVFTGNWKLAWEGVVDIFSNIFKGIVELAKKPLNWVIDGINKFIDGINGIKIPDWVPGVGGKGFSLPKIPRLRIGMDYVPEDDFPAFLHRGEAVLTAEENRALRQIGGISGLESAVSAGMYASANVAALRESYPQPEPIDYERMGESVADGFVAAGVTVNVDSREFGRLVREVDT